MIVVGHRGARAEAPENTVEGFVHASEHGCRYFELDIQLSKDHELMVFHDTSLKRNTGLRGRMSARSSYELRRTDARLNTPGWPQPCMIPRLEDVLDACSDVEHWQFEVKSDSRKRLSLIAQRLAKLISDHGLENRATITSSNKWILSFCAQYSPKLSTGLVYESRFGDPVKTALSLGCNYLILYRKLVTPKLLERSRSFGLHVSVWTVNDLEEMKQLDQMGADSLITDNPTLALEHFVSG